MAGKKGYQATSNLRRRDPSRRGGNAPDEFPSGTPDSLARHAAAYLESLAVRNHTPDTIEGRRDSLKVFLLWSIERDLTLPGTITKPILESYQRHLWHWRKKNGNPLGVSTQRARLGTLKSFFAWLTKQNILIANPASELELPRQEKRLPKQALGLRETRAVLAVPNIRDPLGLRDRAILAKCHLHPGQHRAAQGRPRPLPSRREPACGCRGHHQVKGTASGTPKNPLRRADFPSIGRRSV